MRKIAGVLLCMFVLSFCFAGKTAGYGSGEIIIEQNTGEIVHESNARTRLPMASTTKVMTALVAIEKCEDLNREITIDAKSCNIEGSSIYLKQGETVTVETLLYGLMLRSGNDCAMTLANHVLGSYDAFIDAMNLRARDLGLKDTNFVNPHGLHDDNHYTSCYDLAMITRAAMYNPTFKKIVSTKEIKCGERVFVNKNKMLRSYEGSNGVKTGFTTRAGRCLVSSAERGGIGMVSVVLNCPDMWERSKSLLTMGFNRYENVEFLKAGELGEKGKLAGSGDEIRLEAKNSVVRMVKKADKEKFSTKLTFYKALIPPLKKGEEVGEFQLYYENRLIFSEKIYTMDSVDSYSEDCCQREKIDHEIKQVSGGLGSMQP